MSPGHCEFFFPPKGQSIALVFFLLLLLRICTRFGKCAKQVSSDILSNALSTKAPPCSAQVELMPPLPPFPPIAGTTILVSPVAPDSSFTVSISTDVEVKSLQFATVDIDGNLVEISGNCQQLSLEGR